MHKDEKRTGTVVVLLIKHFVCWGSRCRACSGLFRPRPNVNRYAWISNFFRITTSVHYYPLSRVKKKSILDESDNVWTGESEYFWIRWRSKFVFILLPKNKLIWRHNNKSRAYLPPLPRALWRTLWTHFIAEEPWVLEWIRIDTIGCVWTGEFNLNTPRMDGESFKSTRKKLRIQKYPDTCGRGALQLSYIKRNLLSKYET